MRLMRRLLFVVFIMQICSSCNNKQLADSSLPENQDQLLLSVLWFQKSPEMQALFYQCYNNATESLKDMLKESVDKRPKAVVMDIDETILDNSPFEAYQALENVTFSDSLWNKWTDKAVAEPLPGALDFILFAKSQGVDVFYVTNRSAVSAYKSTISNLKDKGFPFADSLHLILKTSTSSKEERRQTIASRYEILLFIGDNLGDFDSVFDKRGDDLGFATVWQNKNKFGKKFIILPNPMYGPWVNASLKNTSGNTTREKLLNTIVSF
jgi:5'-nucleotidase (lipoprotein e(P4) family)